MIIYRSVNNIDGKCYIGQTTKSLNKRKQSHLCNSKYKRDTSPYFHRSLRKHGEDNFTWEILCECNTKEELDEMEFHYIKQHQSFGDGGYNLTKGGEGGSNGCDVSGKNNPFYGKTHSDVTKKQISEARKGKCMGSDNPATRPEVRKKISEGNKGRLCPWGADCPKGSDNPTSKTYIITYPDGHEEVVIGIREFARNNNLKHQGLFAVMRGVQTHHKGFTCRRVTDEI